jgi:hypothetical protein
MAPPGNDERRPGLGTADHVVADSEPIVTPCGDVEREVTQYLAGLADGDRLGRAAGDEIGYERGRADECAEWTAAMTGCAETWRRPKYAQLQAIRAESPTNQPCPTRCRKCSVCLRSISFWARGGRDFLGVQQERELALAVTR